MKRIEVPTEPSSGREFAFELKHREPGDLPLIATLVNAKRGYLAVSYQWLVKQVRLIDSPDAHALAPFLQQRWDC